MARPFNPNSVYGRIKLLHAANPDITADEIQLQLTDVPRATIASNLSHMRKRDIVRRARVRARKILAEATITKKSKEMVEIARQVPIVAAEPSELDIERIKAAALDPEQRLQMMAEIAANARDEVRLRALGAIHELQLQAGAVQTLPPPTDPDEQIARAARVLEALGREGADKAHMLAFAPRTAPTEAEASEDLPTDAAAAY